MNTLSKTLLVAAVMLSMGATDAVAARAVRGPSKAKAVQKQKRQQRQKRPVQKRQNRVRKQVTNSQQRSGDAPSGQAKAYIQGYTVALKQAIAQGGTPPFQLIPHKDSVVMTQTRAGRYDSKDHSKDTHPAHTVSGLPKSGALSLTSLLPVSAHTGQAENFAKSNVYNVVIQHADGTTQNLGKIPSTGMVTEKVLNLQLKPGKTTVTFWPDGSGGVGGFAPGRKIDLNWSGN